jgi:hypothetical protein
MKVTFCCAPLPFLLSIRHSHLNLVRGALNFKCTCPGQQSKVYEKWGCRQGQWTKTPDLLPLYLHTCQPPNCQSCDLVLLPVLLSNKYLYGLQKQDDVPFMVAMDRTWAADKASGFIDEIWMQLIAAKVEVVPFPGKRSSSCLQTCPTHCLKQHCPFLCIRWLLHK